MEELTSDFLEENKLTAALQIDLEEKNKQNETSKKVCILCSPSLHES